MATRIQTEAYAAISDLSFWYSDQSGKELHLVHVIEIIPLRWTFFRDNWNFLKSSVLQNADSYFQPDLLRSQVERLTRFIDNEKNNTAKNINPFANNARLNDFYTVWDSIPIASINISPQEKRIIDEKTARIQKFTRTNFENIRLAIRRARDELADVIGLADSDYNTTMQRESAAAVKSPKIKDIGSMQIMQKMIGAANLILANSNKLTTTSVDPFALARLNANNPEVQIASGKSSTLVKMNFGDNLQTLAQRYLASPDRWMEIAIANNLKAPYVDEIGEFLPLLSNGNENKITLAKTISGQDVINKIFVGQPVFISSNILKFPSQRSIVNIEQIDISGEIVIELSGEDDLNLYKLSDNAGIRVYKPNTVNSNFFVAIPSPIPIPNSQIGETPFFLQASSEDEKRSGVDFLIGENGDLQFTSAGDLQLSYGVANALQAIQIKVQSERGQSKRNPNFGMPSVSGRKENDPDAIRNTLVNGINDMISVDPRFDRVEQIDIQRGDKNEYRMAIVVRMAGSGSLVPINFKVNTN